MIVAIFALLGVLPVVLGIVTYLISTESPLPAKYIEKHTQMHDLCEKIALELQRPWKERLVKWAASGWGSQNVILKQYIEKTAEFEASTLMLRSKLKPLIGDASVRDLAKLKQELHHTLSDQNLMQYLKKYQELEQLGNRLIKDLETPWERLQWPDFDLTDKLSNLLGHLPTPARPVRVWFRDQFAQKKFRPGNAKAEPKPKIKPEPTENRFRQESSSSKHQSSYRPGQTGPNLRGEAHEILGVSRSADTSEIKRAYRILMKAYHPDKVGQPGTSGYEKAQEITIAINRAKAELMERRRFRRSA